MSVPTAMEVIPNGNAGIIPDVSSSAPPQMITLEDCRAAVKSIFAGTSCYDLIAASSKTIVFETTIPFQLAFFALTEHDTSVAPLWDPTTHAFTGLMTIADYLRALKLCRSENVSMLELSQKTIADLLLSPGFQFQHPDFSSIDAEDSVQSMCFFLNRQGTNFVPILNPDDGTLVSILGYVDLIHLLDQASKQHPELFSVTLAEMNLGIVGQTHAALKATPLINVLESDDNFEGGVPVVDETGTVIGIYHKADVTFISKVTNTQDAQAVLTNLEKFTIDDVLTLQKQQQQQGESSVLSPPLVTCTMQDKISDIVAVMMQARSDVVVVVDDNRKFVGNVSVREIVTFYLM
jgi:5'-AMP-activated protein kinase, regulatory gamma subunit